MVPDDGLGAANYLHFPAALVVAIMNCYACSNMLTIVR